MPSAAPRFPLAEVDAFALSRATMAMEFGWWDKTPEDGKFQICVRIHGGNSEWTRKQGHHTQWEIHHPADADWDKLIEEAARRVPRRLITTKQFAEIESLRDKKPVAPRVNRAGPSRRG